MRVKQIIYDHPAKVNFLYILIISPQYVYKKKMGTIEENSFFDIRG